MCQLPIVQYNINSILSKFGEILKDYDEGGTPPPRFPNELILFNNLNIFSQQKLNFVFYHQAKVVYSMNLPLFHYSTIIVRFVLLVS